MEVIEKNVLTGKTTKRDYTQKELNSIAEESAAALIRDSKINREKDIEAKRDMAIEALLVSSTLPQATIYQNAIES